MNSPPNPKNPNATSPPTKNDDPTIIDTQLPKDPEPNRERLIVNTGEIKFVNNRYITLVAIEFGSSDSESTVNIKNRKLFAAIKLLDPSATITIGGNL